MSNEIRNSLVISLNIQSNRINNLLGNFDISLPNIVETERNKIFEIVDVLKKFDFDFWDESFALRDAVLFALSLNVIKSLDGFTSLEHSIFDSFKTKESFFKPAIENYLNCNLNISSFNIIDDFYKVTCNYAESIYPTSKDIDTFFDLYDNFYNVSETVDASETSKYNDYLLYSILSNKEKDRIKLSTIDSDFNVDDISDDDFLQLLNIGINNFMQMLKITDEDKYKYYQQELNKKSLRKNKLR